MLAALVASLVLCGTGGCTAVVIPPKVHHGGARIFLLDHGHHSSLVLPTADQHIVRYSYGDWTYYALGDTGPYRGTSALFWPTQGALGCRELPGPPRAAAVRTQVLVPIEHIYPLTVERVKVERLRHRLQRVFRDHLDSLHYNPLYDLYFVHDPRDYDVFHDSNHQVATWLKELGCQVHGVTLWSNWRIEHPGDPTPTGPEHADVSAAHASERGGPVASASAQRCGTGTAPHGFPRRESVR